MRKEILLILCLFSAFTVSEWISNTIETSDELVFLGRFVMYGDKENNGTMNLTIETSTPGLGLLTYYDTEWTNMWGSKESCGQKVNASASNNPIRNPKHEERFIFEDGIVHFWYIAVANCEGKKFNMKYTQHWLQAEQGWNQELSYDIAGFQTLYLIFFLFFFGVFVAHFIGDFQLYRSNGLHPIVRMMALAIALEFLSIFLYMLHYAVFAKNGVGLQGAHILGALCDFVASMDFMLILILVAKGWGINHPTLSFMDEQRKIFFGIVGALLVLYIVFFFWSLFGVSPASHLYVYQSAPGALLLTVRVLTAAYFGFCLFQSFRAETDAFKRRFFLIFGIGFLIWFLIIPFVVLCELGDPNPWRRYKVVQSFYLLAQLFGMGAVAFLTWPSRASKYFQVGVPLASQGGYDTL